MQAQLETRKQEAQKQEPTLNLAPGFLEQLNENMDKASAMIEARQAKYAKQGVGKDAPPELCFQVGLHANPVLFVSANSEAEAVQLYRAHLGILSTEHSFQVEQVPYLPDGERPVYLCKAKNAAARLSPNGAVQLSAPMDSGSKTSRK